MGACTRTQDDGTYCQLTFSLPQRAAAVSQLPAFDKYVTDVRLSIPKERIDLLVDRLQEERAFGEKSAVKPEDIAATIEAVAAVEAFRRQSDTTEQSHFRDIFEILTFQGPSDLSAKLPVLRSMNHFATRSLRAELEIQKVPVSSGRTYELTTTPGCIAFGESQFTFMLRVMGTAAPCERPR